MNCDLLNVDNRKVVTPDKSVEGDEREIAQMLVVDRVELDAVDHVAQVRHFNHGDAAVDEQFTDAGDDSVHVGHVRKDVVCVDDIGVTDLMNQVAREPGPEEFRHGPNAARLGERSDGARRLDAEDGYALAHVMLQEIAVVAGDFDHETVGGQRLLRNQPIAERARVGDEGLRTG